VGILSWILVGLVAGFIASKIVSGSGAGFIMDICLGVVGAIVGGFIMSRFLGGVDVYGFNFYSVAVATGGAILVLAVYKMVSN
jgi:uncharacterized membrane protein YeaQ/YmgE (transglycosylase-associated protein family)